MLTLRSLHTDRHVRLWRVFRTSWVQFLIAQLRLTAILQQAPSLSPVLIGGIIAGVLALNCTLCLAWSCLRRRRGRLNKHISASVTVEKFGTGTASPVAEGALRAPWLKGGADGFGGNAYMEKSQVLNPELFTRPPRRQRPRRVLVKHSRDSSSSESSPSSSMSGAILPVASRSYGNRFPPNRALSIRSAYSSASAPLDYHDHLFRDRAFALYPDPPAYFPADHSHPLPPPLAVTVPAPPPRPLMIVTNRYMDAISESPASPPPTSASSQAPLFPAATQRQSYTSSVPPRVRWLGPTEEDGSNANYSRPQSWSSVSTDFSVCEAVRMSVEPAMRDVSVAPLNIRRRWDV